MQTESVIYSNKPYDKLREYLAALVVGGRVKVAKQVFNRMRTALKNAGFPPDSPEVQELKAVWVEAYGHRKAKVSGLTQGQLIVSSGTTGNPNLL